MNRNEFLCEREIGEKRIKQLNKNVNEGGKERYKRHECERSKRTRIKAIQSNTITADKYGRET
jgi:hypothetical protein